ASCRRRRTIPEAAQALGQKQTSAHVGGMSALPPIADNGTQPSDVCFVPKADILRCGKERRYSITSSANRKAHFSYDGHPKALVAIRHAVFVTTSGRVVRAAAFGFPSRVRACAGEPLPSSGAAASAPPASGYHAKRSQCRAVRRRREPAKSDLGQIRRSDRAARRASLRLQRAAL